MMSEKTDNFLVLYQTQWSGSTSDCTVCSPITPRSAQETILDGLDWTKLTVYKVNTLYTINLSYIFDI